MALDIVRTLRLPDSEFFSGTQRKTGIAIHHTVGGSAEASFRLWRRDQTNGGRPNLVGTAYLIDHDGTVFEVFDPAAWAYQFGLRWTPSARLAFERRFIGIEIASEGALIKHDGQLYCFDRISPRTRKPSDEAFDAERLYRGYRWFDRYEPAQLASLGLEYLLVPAWFAETFVIDHANAASRRRRRTSCSPWTRSGCGSARLRTRSLAWSPPTPMPTRPRSRAIRTCRNGISPS